MIFQNIVPIKIHHNTFWNYVSYNSNTWDFDLDFKTYFILTPIKESEIIIKPIPKHLSQMCFLAKVLKKIRTGTFSDEELKPI